VFEASSDLGLVLKALCRTGVLIKRDAVEDLQRDVAIERVIVCEKDDAGTATPDFPLDAQASELRSGRRGSSANGVIAHGPP
jgi:hypothetical protein